MSSGNCGERLEYCMSLLGSVLSLAVKSVRENYGEEGLKNMRQTFREGGVDLGRNEAKRLKTGKADAKTYHLIVNEALKAFGVKHEVTKISETNYILKIYDCPHAKNFASPEVCDVFLELDKGMVEGLNPDLKFKLTKHVKRGDPYCEYVVEPKKYDANM